MRKLLATLVAAAGLTVATIAVEAAPVQAMSQCSAWKIGGLAGGKWSGGRATCRSYAGGGAGIFRVVVFCSNNQFVNGPWRYFINEFSDAHCPAGRYAVSVSAYAP